VNSWLATRHPLNGCVSRTGSSPQTSSILTLPLPPLAGPKQATASANRAKRGRAAPSQGGKADPDGETKREGGNHRKNAVRGVATNPCSSLRDLRGQSKGAMIKRTGPKKIMREDERISATERGNLWIPRTAAKVSSRCIKRDVGQKSAANNPARCFHGCDGHSLVDTGMFAHHYFCFLSA
jgi:hypothetical protein